ncbi:MAG: hypothetical protein NTZ83_02765, partial [Candidatus Pacearchaeota archaeon]|nr:hypothetical protein [Candidatus Pacearchaeota archaeon]
MEKKRFFYLKNTLILSVLLFLFISIPPVFASELNQNLTYDGNGNLITGDGKYRVYNEFNQLIRVYDGSDSSGDILESYLYHPIENRILIKYWYDGVNIEGAVAYINENLEEEYYLGWGDNNHLSNFTYYIYDENGLAGEIVKNRTYSENITDHQYYPDALVSVKNLSYHNDYSGTVSLITNSSGGVVEQTFYEPFGGILEGGNESRYSYEGKEFSSATEDFDFHFRKYDPSLMIFTQPDSVIADVYDPQSLNRYAFERNNPYKYVDEDGKIPQKPLANLQNAWRFGNGNEFSKLGQDLTNTLNSKEFAPYRFAWSLTLEPFYKGIKSYSEISTRLSYGKDY